MYIFQVPTENRTCEKKRNEEKRKLKRVYYYESESDASEYLTCRGN